MVNSNRPVFKQVSEKQLQGSIVRALQLLGYTVFETGKTRTKVSCPTCKTRHYATGYQGNTIGLPDIYIHNSKWKTPIGVGIELKTEKGKVQDKQQMFASLQVTAICRSLDDVLDVLHTAELVLGNDDTLKKLEAFISNEYRRY
jgi:hypothetical protein